MQVLVRPVLGMAASVASARSGSGSCANTHACLAVVAGVDGGGRRCGPMVRADGGFWRMGLDGSGQLLAQEGQEGTQREEGPSMGGNGRVRQGGVTDREG